MTDLSDFATSEPARQRLGRIADLIERSGIDLDDIGRVDKVRIGQHDMVTKVRNADGTDTVETHSLPADSILLTPTWETGPEWPVVQPAAPTTIRPTTAKPRTPDGIFRWGILPDPQIGYRVTVHSEDDVEVVPFHDDTAMDVALQVLRSVKPDGIVNLGDTLDFPELSRFEQLPEFAHGTQMSVDRAHRWLAQQRASFPDARIVLMEGNHDARLPKQIAKNAMAALRLKRAAEPESWPVLSVPHLLRLDELDVTYVDGYPAGTFILTSTVAVNHGSTVASKSSTAARVANEQSVSRIFGHVHRVELHYRTVEDSVGGSRKVFGWSPGCLSRIDGAVPSTKGGTDAHGRFVPTVENWQQAVGILDVYEDGTVAAPESVLIEDGRARFRGREFVAREAG